MKGKILLLHWQISAMIRLNILYGTFQLSIVDKVGSGNGLDVLSKAHEPSEVNWANISTPGNSIPDTLVSISIYPLMYEGTFHLNIINTSNSAESEHI